MKHRPGKAKGIAPKLLDSGSVLGETLPIDATSERALLQDDPFESFTEWSDASDERSFVKF